MAILRQSTAILSPYRAVVYGRLTAREMTIGRVESEVYGMIRGCLTHHENRFVHAIVCQRTEIKVEIATANSAVLARINDLLTIPRQFESKSSQKPSTPVSKTVPISSYVSRRRRSLREACQTLRCNGRGPQYCPCELVDLCNHSAGDPPPKHRRRAADLKGASRE